jgi:polar amino acid transport system substrate-binding protein
LLDSGLEDGVAAKSLSATAAAAALALASIAAAAAEQASARPINPYEGSTELVPEGKSLFNQYCSHCHGPDAVQGERPRDLRRLNRRYGDNAIGVFYTTINDGRMDKGMPVWKGVLDEDTIWKIYTFLSSVQAR